MASTPKQKPRPRPGFSFSCCDPPHLSRSHEWISGCPISPDVLCPEMWETTDRRGPHFVGTWVYAAGYLGAPYLRTFLSGNVGNPRRTQTSIRGYLALRRRISGCPTSPDVFCPEMWETTNRRRPHFVGALGLRRRISGCPISP